MSNTNIITQVTQLSNQETFTRLQSIRAELSALIDSLEPAHPAYLARLTQAEAELTSAVHQLDTLAAGAAIRQRLQDDPAACWNSEAGQ